MVGILIPLETQLHSFNQNPVVEFEMKMKNQFYLQWDSQNLYHFQVSSYKVKTLIQY